MGTEFLIRFDPTANETVLTMFDGQGELDNGVEQRRITSGFQGIARPGQRIEVRPSSARDPVRSHQLPHFQGKLSKDTQSGYW